MAAGPNLGVKVAGLEAFPDATDAARWKAELEMSEKEFDAYWDRCDQITRRYRLEKENGEARDDEALCLLWGQVQTEIPAIYQRKPEPEVSRRFDAKDPAARVASLIAERYLAVDIERQGIDGECESMVRAYLLYDRAVAWVDIEPEFGQGEDGEELVVDLRAPAIYLTPRDFLHSASRNWREVTWVARRHFFTRDAAVERFADGMSKFGWEVDDLPLDAEPTYRNDAARQAAGDIFKRCVIWEIWDDESGQVIYVNRGMEKLVDLRPMPARLEARFPCPEPCYGTLTDGSLIPVPAFIQWQVLSDEIDELSTRIRWLTAAVRIAGTHDESVPELAKILQPGAEENTLVPVKNWSALREQGGMPGSISLLPLTDIVNALQVLGEQRQQRIDLLNLLTGHTDIMRGQGDPQATATSERIKSNYGSLRLQEKQADFARFMQRMLRIKAEIIVELAPEDVLIAVSSAEDLPEVQEARAAQQQAMQQAMQQQMQPPGAPPGMGEPPGGPPSTGMGAPQGMAPPPPQMPPPQEDILVQATRLLKDDRLRDFRLDVVERSMAAIDEGQEKAEATEFAEAMGAMLEKLAGAPPELLDVGGEAALFVARKHRVGRELESAFENAIKGLKDKAEAARAQPPQPPEAVQVEEMKAKNEKERIELKHGQDMARINLEAQTNQAAEQAQADADRAMKQFEMQMKERMAQSEAQWDAWLKEREMNFDMQLAERKAGLDEKIAMLHARQESAALALKTETDRMVAASAEREKRKKRKLRVRDASGEVEEFEAEFVDGDTLQ